MGSVADSTRKLDRASYYLDLLEKSTNAFIKDPEAYAFRIQPKPNSANYFLIGWVAKPCTSAWGLLVGDIANNARCALDYIVDRISGLPADSQDRYKIGFPICADIPRWNIDGRKQFFNIKKRLLKGVSDPAINTIESFQPYKCGGDTDPLAILQRINNGDKHHAIRVVTAAGRQVGFTLEGYVWGYMNGKPLTKLRAYDGVDLSCYQIGAFVERIGDGVFSEHEAVIQEFHPGKDPENKIQLVTNFRIVVQFALGQAGLAGLPVIPAMRRTIDRVKEILGKFP